MEISKERKEKIEKLRLQLPFLNEYQKESNNPELQKHCNYIQKIFENSSKEDIKLPDAKLDLLINSVEKLKEYMNTQSTSENVPAQEKNEETSLNNSTASTNDPSDNSGSGEIDEKRRKANVQRRKEMELRRLHENIVKEPLPSRRALKRSSRYQEFADSEENLKRKSGGRNDSSSSETKLTLKITKLDSSKDSEKVKKVEVAKAFSTSTPKISRLLPTKNESTTAVKKSPVLAPAKRKSDTLLENVEKKTILTVVKNVELPPAKVPPIKIFNLNNKIATIAKPWIKPIAPKQRTVPIPIAPKAISPVRTVPIPAKKSPNKIMEKLRTKPLQKIEIQPKVQAVVQEKDTNEESFKLKKLVLKIPLHQNKLIKKKTIRRVLTTNDVMKKNSPSKDKEEDEWEDCEDDDDDNDIPMEEAETEEDKITRNDINNMTYVAVRQGFIFQCLAKNCWFQTMKKFSFINHLEEKHKEMKWDGFCNMCGFEVSNGKKGSVPREAEDEFWHMMEAHVHKEKNRPENLPDVVEIPVEMIKNPISKKITPLKLTKKSSPVNNVEKNHSPLKPLKKLTLQLTQEIGSIISSQLLKDFAPLPQKESSSVQSETFTSDKKENDLSNHQEKSPPLQKLKKVSLLKPKLVEECVKNVDTVKKVEVPQLRHHEILKQDSDPKKISPLIGKKVTLGKLTNLTKIITPPTKSIVQTKLAEKISETTSKQEPSGKKTNEDQIEDKTLYEPVSNVVNLRPWLSRPAKKFLNRAVKLLAPSSLIATFKCMGPKCEFYTSNPFIFRSHLESHISAAPGNIANYLICPYCDANFTVKSLPIASITDLISHIQEAHCYDNYQCKYCYYRSCANFNVLTHQRIHHRMQQHVIIKISHTRQRDYQAEVAIVSEKCKKNIRALMCATCKSHGKEDKKFYVLQHFYSHLKEHEKNKEIIKARCKKCHLLVDSAESLYSHVFNCFENIALYQCVHCVFGADSTELMHEHLSNFHPSEVSLVCMRTDDNPMKEIAQPWEIESMSLKFISLPVDKQLITSFLKETQSLDETKKLNNQEKKESSEDEEDSEDEHEHNDQQNNQPSSGLQIKSVFSLSRFGR